MTFLQSTVHISTTDYHGRPRTTGGDPISVTLTDPNGDDCSFDLTDNEDGTWLATSMIIFSPCTIIVIVIFYVGTYVITYVPYTLGAHQLNVTIFSRPIKGSPFEVQVTHS